MWERSALYTIHTDRVPGRTRLGGSSRVMEQGSRPTTARLDDRREISSLPTVLARACHLSFVTCGVILGECVCFGELTVDFCDCAFLQRRFSLPSILHINPIKWRSLARPSRNTIDCCSCEYLLVTASVCFRVSCMQGQNSHAQTQPAGRDRGLARPFFFCGSLPLNSPLFNRRRRN